MPRFNTQRPFVSISPDSMFNRLVGRPTNELYQRQADETAEILRQMAERETDPTVKEALLQAIELGTFSAISPLEAGGVSLSDAERRRVENLNLERDRSALQLLGAEFGVENLPPELIEQFGLDTETPLGTRTDRLRSDILNRLGQQQGGFEQREMGIAEVEAARRGQQVTAQDASAIRNRAAGLFGRQRQVELGDLRREQEFGRQRALGGLVGTLTGTTFQGDQFGDVLGQVAENKPSFTRGMIGRTSNPRGFFGASLSGGGQIGGGRGNSASDLSTLDRALALLRKR